VLFTAVSPQGRQLAGSCRDRKVRVWSLPAGKLTHTLELGEANISALAFSRNGKRLGAGGSRGLVRVFDAESAAVVHESSASASIDALALSPDGKRLAFAATELPVQLWDLTLGKGKLVAELKEPFSGAMGLAFSPDGRFLAATNANTTVRVFEAATGHVISSFEELDAAPFALDFTPDSKMLVVGGADKLLVALDPATGKPVHRLAKQPDPIGSIAVLGDGRTVIASCFNADNMSETRALLAWNMATGESKTLSPNTSFNGGGISSGGLLLTSGDKGTLKLWTVR